MGLVGKFVCVCPKHGLDVHDGTKNECCDAAVIMPMLETLNILKPKGQEQFRNDAVVLGGLIRESRVDLSSKPEVLAWYKQVVVPIANEWHEQAVATEVVDPAIIEGELQEAEESAAEEEDISMAESMNNAYIAGFTKGHESAYLEAFSKGFDLGQKLNLNKLMNK